MLCNDDINFFFFFYKIEILLYPNLSVYVCETPSWRFELWPLPFTPISTYTCGVTIVLRVCSDNDDINY